MKYGFNYVILCLIVLCACSEDKTPKEALAAINPSIHVPIIRMEQLLQDGDLTQVEKAGPLFYNLYFREILGIQDSENFQTINQEITQDSGYQNLYEEVQINYSDLGDLQSEINQALENYIEVFDLPKEAIPNIYTFISGFVYQTLVFQDGDMIQIMSLRRS